MRPRRGSNTCAKPPGAHGPSSYQLSLAGRYRLPPRETPAPLAAPLTPPRPPLAGLQLNEALTELEKIANTPQPFGIRQMTTGAVAAWGERGGKG